MKKEVIVINYMGRHGSGNMHAIVMAKALQEAGENVVAVVSAFSDNIREWEQLELTKLIVVQTYQTKAQFVYRTIDFYLREAYAIRRQLAQYTIKAVYCPMTTYWTYGLNRALKNQNVIVCNHDPIPHSGDRKKWSFHKALQTSHTIIVHSKKFIDYVKKQYPGKNVLYMPLTRLNVYGKGEKICTVTYPTDKVNFLFFGVISKYKGLDVLAEAYKKVKVVCPNTTLTIGGNGDFSAYQEKYSTLSDVTIVNRWIADEEIESFFTGENIITVLPYVDATQSGVALVAMEYNTPVIATRTGGLPEQVEDGVLGLLVPPSNVEALADAMVRLAQDEKLREEMKRNIKVKMRETEDSVLAHQLIEIINDKRK